jgi:hypothetical protein
MVLALAALPSFAGTKPEAARIFTDQGAQYLRTDNKRSLAVGAELVATDESKKQPVGKVVIMEVRGSLARISLDEDATKAGARYALIPEAKPAAAAPAPATPAPAPPAAPAAKLSASLEPGMRIRYANLSDQDWTGCSLRTDEGKTLDVGDVPKHSEDTTMKFKLKSPPDPVYDHLTVSCSEGASKFYFARPNAPEGALKGYATNDKGSVVVFNQGANSWSACDVTKPDGTHYVLGNLKASDSDSIDKGRFVREQQAKGQGWLELRCKEGAFRVNVD